MGHVLRHDKELHYTIIEGAIESQKRPRIPRKSYISQLKKSAGIDTHAEGRLAEDRKNWSTRLNGVIQPNTG